MYLYPKKKRENSLEKKIFEEIIVRFVPHVVDLTLITPAWTLAIAEEGEVLPVERALCGAKQTRCRRN